MLDFKSPDLKHNISLQCAGEIPWGPPYYFLVINEQEIKNKIFGKLISFSDDSRYLAAQEWVTIKDTEGGLRTRVNLFDLSNQKVSEFKTVYQGFAEGFKFEGSIFIYKKHYYEFEQEIINEVEVDINQITNWKSITER